MASKRNNEEEFLHWQIDSIDVKRVRRENEVEGSKLTCTEEDDGLLNLGVRLCLRVLKRCNC